MAYTGSLTAADLTVEDLGCALVNVIGFAVAYIRGVYTKTAGSGTLNVRYRAMSN